MKTVFVMGDHHIPHIQDSAMKLAEDVIYDIQPEIIVINGDFLDCASLGKFPVVPNRTGNFKDEIALGQSYLSDIRKKAPNAKIYFIEGNHEFRLRSNLIRNAPELYDSLAINDLLKLKDFGIEWIGTKQEAAKWTDTYINIDGIYVGHYDRVSKHAGYTVKNIIDDMGVSVVQAHIHRVAFHARRLLDGRIIEGAESGCMCKLDAPYKQHNNWQNGFCLIECSDTEAHITPVMIRNNEAVVRGKLYT